LKLRDIFINYSGTGNKEADFWFIGNRSRGKIEHDPTLTNLLENKDEQGLVNYSNTNR